MDLKTTEVTSSTLTFRAWLMGCLDKSHTSEGRSLASSHSENMIMVFLWGSPTTQTGLLKCSHQHSVSILQVKKVETCFLVVPIPFCAVVLATEYSHFFVVKKWSSSKCSPLCVIDVAADILCWKRTQTLDLLVYSERQRKGSCFSH